MVAYSTIGSKVWQTVVNVDSESPASKSSREQMSYVDYKIKQWYEDLPLNLKYVHPQSDEAAKQRVLHPNDPEAINANGGRAMHRLRIVLYLRLNQMRILIFRPVLNSATSIAANENGATAQTVVDIAKDTIIVLTHVNQTSNIYRAQQMQFNYFLVSALAVLFLAVSHAPAKFSANCRDEFYMALDLVRGLSSTSVVSKRLWTTIKGLKQIGPKLGLYARNAESNDANQYSQSPEQSRSQPNHRDTQNSAAMAMARLAGHSIDENAFFAAHQQGGQYGNGIGTQGQAAYAGAPTGMAHGMANDLTSLFEAAGGYGGAVGGTPAMTSGNEEEFGRIMKDLF